MVEINEEFKPWTKVWDAAAIMMDYLSNESPNANKKRAIDVGAGTGVVGIELCNREDIYQVYLTDIQKALPGLEESIKDLEQWKKEKILVKVLDWLNCEEDVKHLGGPFDIVICSDLIYFRNLYKPLVQTLLLLTNANSVIYLSYRQRELELELEFFELFGNYFDFKIVKRINENDQRGDIFLFECSLECSRLNENIHTLNHKFSDKFWLHCLGSIQIDN